MKVSGFLARLRGPVAFWALAGVALLASHDAIFMAQVGPGEQLTRTLREAGHDYWELASLLLAAVGIGVGLATLLRLRSLRRRADDLAGEQFDGFRTRRFTRALGLWAKLFAVVAGGFILQENLEHLTVHGHAPGLGALVGPEYPLAVPVIGLVTALAASSAESLRRTEQQLLDAIEAVLRSAFEHAPRRLTRPPPRFPARRMSPMAHAIAGRAPPSMLHLPGT